MGRACLLAVVALGAALAAGASATDAKQARRLEPSGGIWQSIPYKADSGPSESVAQPAAARLITAAGSTKLRPAAKAAPLPHAKPSRHPVAAAAVAEAPPPTSAAARTKELERRLDVLMPGARLGEPMADPENPAWRRAHPGRPAADAQTLSVPFDEKGQSGFIARGYHVEPDAQNTKGHTGATFGLRTRF